MTKNRKCESKSNKNINDTDDQEGKQYDTLPWYTAEERSVFIAIDRDQENKDIDCFQRTKDMVLFEKIYKARIPTLQIWARRYQYLMDSKEDMFGELSYFFTKAVLTYKINRGSSFNTCLFTYLINCIRNLQIGRRAKKRLPDGVDPNSMSKFMLSLDYNYDGKDGSENTLRDILANKMSSKETVVEKMGMDETVNILSNGNPQIVGWLKKLGEGSTITALIKECKTRNGNIYISHSQAKKLRSGRKQKKVVMALIKSKTDIHDDFSVVDYCVLKQDSLHYTIEMRKTKEADLILKTIRKLRKEKRNIMDRIEA